MVKFQLNVQIKHPTMNFILTNAGYGYSRPEVPPLCTGAWALKKRAT